MANIFYIVANKIKEGVIKVFNSVQAALKKFFEAALDFLRRASVKYSQKEGCEYKGETHCYGKKDGVYREGTDIIHLDKEIGEYYRTTVMKKVDEMDVPPQYRDIKDDEFIDNTAEIDAVLSF